MELSETLPQKKEIYRSAIDMAWPAVLESFLIAMTVFLDSIMVSSQGEEAIAAIGLTSQPKFIAMCLFSSLGIAISSIVARRRGEQNRDSAVKVMKIGLVFTVVVGTIVVAALIIFINPIIHIVGSKEDTHDIAVGYLTIVSGGLLFNLITIVINAAQRGAGNTRISMTTNSVSNLVNVTFNFLLIEGRFGFPEWGVNGAAVATVLGGAVACAMSIRSVLKKDSYIYLGYIKGILPSKKDIRSMLDVGISAFIEQSFMRVGFLLFAITVANLGTDELAAHMIAMNFIHISFSFADGLAVASVALVGRSLGKKQPQLAKIYGITCQKIGFVCSLLIASVFIIFGETLFSLFTDKTIILEYGVMLMNIISITIFLQMQQVTILGCLRGAGDTKYTAFVSLISVSTIRPIASYLLAFPLGFGLIGAWVGLNLDQLIRFIMGGYRYRKGKWLNKEI